MTKKDLYILASKFSDEQFMTAQEKTLVLNAWERFLRLGLRRQDFTKALYRHLTLHCSFIAHYSIDGFYSVYFGTQGYYGPRSQAEDRQATRDFLRQFLTGNSVEYGGARYWLTGSCADLNRAMMDVAKIHAPSLIVASRNDSFEDIPEPSEPNTQGAVSIGKDS
jgi:hypothetical protein